MPNIELILARSLAAHLSVPVFLADEKGRFVYFNEAAEMLIGRTMEETVEFGPDVLLELLDPRREDGSALTTDDLPVPRAVVDRVPTHLHALSGRHPGRRQRATAVPLLDREGDAIGALLFVYEEKS